MEGVNDLAARLPAEVWRPAADLPWPKVGSGKVRELYDLGDALALVATDRISAFDVVLPQGVPGKGIVLTQISLLAFRLAAAVVPHHLVEPQEARVAALAEVDPGLPLRTLVVRKLRPLPVECVVRGHLAGSAWKAYSAGRPVHGVLLAPGLREGDALSRPLFTPSTKAAAGHDEPLTHAEAASLLGSEVFEAVERASLELFALGQRWGRAAGLLLADTKFEFGVDGEGRLHLIDEAFTPDSSRWWDAARFRPGEALPGFDKQYVRDHLDATGWGRSPPAPELPRAVVDRTRDLYVAAWDRLRAGAARITEVVA